VIAPWLVVIASSKSTLSQGRFCGKNPLDDSLKKPEPLPFAASVALPRVSFFWKNKDTNSQKTSVSVTKRNLQFSFFMQHRYMHRVAFF